MSCGNCGNVNAIQLETDKEREEELKLECYRSASTGTSPFDTFDEAKRLYEWVTKHAIPEKESTPLTKKQKPVMTKKSKPKSKK